MWYRHHYYATFEQLEEAKRKFRAEARAEKEKQKATEAALKVKYAKFSIDILTKSLIAQALQPSSVTDTKAWGESLKIIIQPEIICPYCKQSHIVPETWIFDRESLRLQAAIKMDGTRNPITHPHITSGTICFGDAERSVKGIVSAMCLGLNPQSAYGGASMLMKWLRSIGHCCWDDEMFHHIGVVCDDKGHCGCYVISCCQRPACQCTTNFYLRKFHIRHEISALEVPEGVPEG